MGRSSKEVYGAAGSAVSMLFDPDALTIVEDPKHPLFDKRGLEAPKESLVRSILKFGVLQPVVISRDGETGNVLVVAGRRRVIACREANQRLRSEGSEPLRITCIPKRGDADLMGMMVVENEHREKDGPLNRAEKLQRYLDLGRSEEEACITFGISLPTLKNMQALLGATDALKKAVQAGKVTAADGYKLARLSPAEQRDKLGKIEAHAPRDPTKKRSKNAAKAREIIEGPKRKKKRREMAAPTATESVGTFVRPFSDISILLDKVRTIEEIRENDRKVAVAVLDWVIGNDEALSAFMTVAS